MEIRLEIEQREINRLLRNARRFSEDMRRQIQRLIEKYAFLIEGGAKDRAPVNKKIGLGGQLRSQIRVELGNLVAYIVAGADYSIFQELGTGQRGQASRVEAEVSGYTYGTVPGVFAQPFLFPSFQQFIDGFLRELRGLFR